MHNCVILLSVFGMMFNDLLKLYFNVRNAAFEPCVDHTFGQLDPKLL